MLQFADQKVCGLIILTDDCSAVREDLIKKTGKCSGVERIGQILFCGGMIPENVVVAEGSSVIPECAGITVPAQKAASVIPAENSRDLLMALPDQIGCNKVSA